MQFLELLKFLLVVRINDGNFCVLQDKRGSTREEDRNTISLFYSQRSGRVATVTLC